MPCLLSGSSRPALCSGKDAILKHNKQAGFGYLGLHCMLEALTPPRDSRPGHAPPSRRVQEKKRKFLGAQGLMRAVCCGASDSKVGGQHSCGPAFLEIPSVSLFSLVGVSLCSVCVSTVTISVFSSSVVGVSSRSHPRLSPPSLGHGRSTTTTRLAPRPCGRWSRSPNCLLA